MSTPAWRKSTRSDDYGNCVEVATLSNAVGIRDSKALGSGHLTLARHTFANLLNQMKRNEPSR